MAIAGLGTPYWYEWEIGLIECLKMLTDNTIASVTLQSSDFVSLDDVVVKYTDNSICNIQVKHTDIQSTMNYSFLSGRENELVKWATEWKKEKEKHSIKEVRIVTNRTFGKNRSDGKCSFENFVAKVLPELKVNYSYTNSINEYDSKVKIKEKNELNNAAEWLRNNLKFLGDDASEFVKILSFSAVPDLEGIDTDIRAKIKNIIGTDKTDAVEACIKSLRNMLETWSTSQRTKEEITREDVYSSLCTNTRKIPSYELYPTRPIFPSRTAFAKQFVKIINESNKKIIFLEGMPGAGKTNFISFLSQLDQPIVDFRYYTYIPPDINYPSYSDDEGFYSGDLLWNSLLEQLRNKFFELGILSKIQFPIVYSFLSTTEMRKCVLQFLSIYAQEIKRDCYVFIDGLDHAARSYDIRRTFIHQLPTSDEIGTGVKFILVGQPINDRYPEWISNRIDVYKIQLPNIESIDIKTLIEFEQIKVDHIDIDTFSTTISDVVGNNALNIIFAIFELKKIKQPLQFDEVVSHLIERNLNLQINKYYEWIIDSTEQSLLLIKILVILGYVSRKVSLSELSMLCGNSEEDVLYITNCLYPLVVNDEWGYYALHNDVRLFFKNKVTSNSNFISVAKVICRNIKVNNELMIYRYELLIELLLIQKDLKGIFDVFDTTYILNSIQFEISVNKLIRQFNRISLLLKESDTLECLPELSVVGMSIAKYADCIEYSEKEYVFVESKRGDMLTQSEKYRLSSQKDFKQIVDDVYQLTKGNKFDRGSRLFSTYLADKLLSEYFLESVEKEHYNYEDSKFLKKSGYICRFYNKDIIEQDFSIHNAECASFVHGWLSASTQFLDTYDDVKDTFNFSGYYKKDLMEFTQKVCETKNLKKDICILLKDIYEESDFPISVLIEMATFLSLQHYDVSTLVSNIFGRIDELEGDNSVKFEPQKITTLIKLMFCCFDDNDEFTVCEKLYNPILLKGYVKPTDRGYIPACNQLKIVKELFNIFYEKQDPNNLNNIIIDISYFVKRNGTGSSYDCDGYNVMKFLRNVVTAYILKKNTSPHLHHNACKIVNYIMTGDEPKFVGDFISLFNKEEDLDLFLEIVEYWFGKKGKSWSLEYSELEYQSSIICSCLDSYSQTEISSLIRKRTRYKLLGFVGHKDYSLSGLLDCYESLPLNEDKLCNHAMTLLSISDLASSIGDNRNSLSIEKQLFNDALSLGEKYVVGLFELKNNPGNFLRWREYLLSALLNENRMGIYNDSELQSLLRLVNAWINKDIEQQRPYNRLDTLYKYNQRIIHHIDSVELREELNKKYYFDCNEKHDHQAMDIKSEKELDLIEHLQKNGYDAAFEDMVNVRITDSRSSFVRQLITLKEDIQSEHVKSFVKNCIVPYVVNNGEYSFRASLLEELITAYSPEFDQEDWFVIYGNVITRIDEYNYIYFYSVANNIELLTMLYIKCNYPNKIQSLYELGCRSNEIFLSADNLIEIEKYSLKLVDDIKGISDMVEYLIG